MRWYVVNDAELSTSALHGYLVLMCMFRRRRPDSIGYSCFSVFRLAPW